MPRTARIAPGGIIYHALNRGCGRCSLFDKVADYDAFERVLDYAMERDPTRILAYSLMPNHWHFVLWPREDGELTRFLRRLTHTHTQRWHAHRHSAGTGHLYQGRFKSFPVEQDDHLLTVIRYVERNALRADLVQQAEQWRWSSLWRRLHGNDRARAIVHPWPVQMPADWVERVNLPHTPAELAALRHSCVRGTPFGSERWKLDTAARLELGRTLRRRGQPPGEKA
jgi:putative transposase